MTVITNPLDQWLDIYGQRPVTLSDQEIAERRREVMNANASGRLSGAPILTENGQRIVELWIVGKIDEKEHLNLVRLNIGDRSSTGQGPVLASPKQ